MTFASKIPVVDFSDFLNSANVNDKLTVAKAVTDACREVGFVYIVNHGLSQDLLDEAFVMSTRLFDLTHKEKMQAPHPDGSAVHRGYSHPGLEKVSQYNADSADSASNDEAIRALREIQDFKESYEIGSEGNEEQPNIWLPEGVLPSFEEFTTKFYWECNKVARTILQAIALGIGLEDPDYLLRLHSGHNNQLRLLHYPSLPAALIESKRVARMPAHTDWSTITLLFQDDCGGLEIEDPHKPGEFVPATPVPGACVVNVGDLLMRWSNDYLKSTSHRVTLPRLSDRFEGDARMTKQRYSIPYFVGADPDAVVECLPACTDPDHPAKYEPITQRAYNNMRAGAMYQKHAVG